LHGTFFKALGSATNNNATTPKIATFDHKNNKETQNHTQEKQASNPQSRKKSC
jgi:hypothetical protein